MPCADSGSTKIKSKNCKFELLTINCKVGESRDRRVHHALCVMHSVHLTNENTPKAMHDIFTDNTVSNTDT